MEEEDSCSYFALPSSWPLSSSLPPRSHSPPSPPPATRPSLALLTQAHERFLAFGDELGALRDGRLR
jgi:hypothetical protein